MTNLSVSPGDVILIRHGETAWSLSGQHTSVTDIPLTENGERTATKLAPILAGFPIDLVLSSPLQRAQQTCELAGMAAHKVIDPDLLEWNYGDYEGLTTAEIRLQSPGWLVFRDGCPGGETPQQVAERVDRLIARAQQQGGIAALFAHGHVLRVLAARWIGLTPEQGAHFLLDTSTLSILSNYRGIPAFKYWNAPLQGA